MPITTADSLANIHDFGARAGLIGFAALHHACLDLLEAGPNRNDVQAAFGRLRAKAEWIYPEIDRECAQLFEPAVYAPKGHTGHLDR